MHNNIHRVLFPIQMKTLISIPLILLLLFSGIVVNIATHYCEGYVVETKVSFSGELASCGMEDHSDHNPFQEELSSPCCDDVMSAYSFGDNYFTSSFSVEKPFPHITNLFIGEENLLLSHLSIFNYIPLGSRPPGDYIQNDPDLKVLCIFRI